MDENGQGGPLLRAVLVTGASGFVGQHVVRALLESNAAQEVRCLTRTETSELLALQHEYGISRVKICIGDLLGPACRTTVGPHLTADGGCDGLINCAAHYRWWTRNPELYHALNEAAVSELMALALEAGVQRIVQVSTILAMGCPAGGWGSAARPLQPDTPPGAAASRYASSKAAGDAVVLRLAAEGGLPGCVVALACVVGADRRLVSGPEEDVMRIADLVRGKVPATLGHDKVFTYIGVRDAAAAIIAALLLGRPGQRYLVGGRGGGAWWVAGAECTTVASMPSPSVHQEGEVGNQRMTTAEYYETIAQLSGTPAPRGKVPVWAAAVWAAAAAGYARLTGVPPQAPPDLIRTVAYGTLLFDSSSSEAELRLQVPYRSIAESFREAVQYIKEYDQRQDQNHKPRAPGQGQSQGQGQKQGQGQGQGQEQGALPPS